MVWVDWIGGAMILLGFVVLLIGRAHCGKKRKGLLDQWEAENEKLITSPEDFSSEVADETHEAIMATFWKEPIWYGVATAIALLGLLVTIIWGG